MSELPRLMIVERVGDRTSPIQEGMQNPTMGHASVLADGEEGGEYLAADILASLGKNTSHGRLKKMSEGGIQQARIWLGAEEIGDLFIGRAEELNLMQVKALAQLSKTSRIWLLFTEELPPNVAASLSDHEPGTMGRNSLRRWLAGRDNRDAEDWADLPALPRSSALTFRHDCRDVLNSFDMLRVDAAIARGVDRARYALKALDSPSAESVARAGLDSSVPTWPSLAMLRGAQLGALSLGWALRFDTTAWLQSKSAVPTLSKNSLQAIREKVLPADGALVIIHSVTGAPPSSLMELTFGDISDDCAEVAVGRRTYEIPRGARPIIRAHREFVQHRVSQSPLFPSRSGAKSKKPGIARRLSTSLLQVGLPESVEVSEPGRRSHRRSSQIADHIGLKLDELPN